MVFKMPKPVTIMGRSSSITNSFVNGIIPCIKPTDMEIETALNILGMEKNKVLCAYCGDIATEWDHLRPLIVDKKPTGYISEIHNLVPACGKCNQSKGNLNWREWINGDAKLSPKSRKIQNIEEKVELLEKYEKWGNPIKIDFEEIVGKELWGKHWNNYALLIKEMEKCQETSSMIKELIDIKINTI